MLQTIKVFAICTRMRAIQPTYYKRYAFDLIKFEEKTVAALKCDLLIYLFAAIPLYLEINQIDDKVNRMGHYTNVSFTGRCE